MSRSLPAALAATLAACASVPASVDPSVPGTAGRAAASPRPVAVVEGFSGPEAVRYDPEQDVYFVANFNGESGAADDNGFISRVRPDGTIEQLRFVAGGANGVTLHAPRGMAIAGDTLWAADVDAVRGFHRRTGAPLATVSFAGQDVGFLNDVAVGPDGALHVTDTGRDRVYRIGGGAISVAVADSALGRPNGITWDATGGRFLVVPFGGAHAIRAWRPAGGLEEVGTGPGARYDGVEVLAGGRVLVASQADSSLHIFEGGQGRAVIRVGGRPADIGVDTRRNRVAVPFIALDRVEIWALP
jgi:sugar lactone lactonase YvrE